jgi:hypothetical protein
MSTLDPKCYHDHARPIPPRLSIQAESLNIPSPASASTAETFHEGLLDYFKISLSLREKYHLYSTFSKRGIIPSDSEPYRRTQFNDALKADFGYPGGIQCVRGSDGRQYLSEVWLYLRETSGFGFVTSSPDLVLEGAYQSCNEDIPVWYPKTRKKKEK